MGVIAAIAGVFFWVHVHKLGVLEDELNNLGDGQSGQEVRGRSRELLPHVQGSVYQRGDEETHHKGPHGLKTC